MTIDRLISEPRYWDIVEGYLSEDIKGNSRIYSRIEKINDSFYIGVRKEEHLNNSSPQYNL